jgi:carboxyl-terminal processing protease
MSGGPGAHVKQRTGNTKFGILSAFAICVVGLAAVRKDDIYPQLGAFARVLALIEQTYIEKIPPQTLVERATAAMLKSLDRHSEYIPAATFRGLRGEAASPFAHVGIDTRFDGKRWVIAGLLPESPAVRSGLRAGDTITAIDGRAADAAPPWRGSAGSRVVLTIERPGFVVPRKFTLVREPLPDIAVSLERRGEWLVATIKRFPDRVTRMFEDIVTAEKAKGPITGIVLDLRHNPGGLIEEAVKLLDLFLDEGPLLTTVGRDDQVLERFAATTTKKAWPYKVAVLVDRQSASAAEIVAGAFQDTKRGLVLGEKSFGKGSVQTIVELDDGAAVRLTTALYLTPANRKVEGQGITPDVVLSAGDWVDDAISRAREP